MNTLDSILERNKGFAAHQSATGTLMPSLPRALPNVRAIIIGCADMRVDPAHVLRIKPGEAVVMRNIGGRITPGLLEQLALLGRIGEVAREIPGGGGEFSSHRPSTHRLWHHPPRQRSRHADALLSNRGRGTQEKKVTDPRAAVAVDVALLRAIPELPSDWLISGLVYDVATGLVEIVEPPALLRAA